MNILRVSQTVYPDEKGGGPYHVHALSRDQAATGHNVTVLTTTDDPEKPTVETRSGYRVLRYRPQVTPLGNDISIELAKYLYQADAFDIVHAHSHLYFSTNLAALRRRLNGTPLAITNHGLFSQSAPEWVFDLYLATLGRWTFNQSDVIFCYTNADRRRIQQYGVKTPVEVVPNGIDTSRFTPAGDNSDEITDNGISVLFVGRLVEGKRPQDAIKAVQQLTPEYDVTLYVCGTGPAREELEELAGPETVFLGHVPYDRMPAIYRSADILVLPSRAEGTPRVIMEALSTQTPVISSDLEQVRDAFGEAIRYVPLESPQAIAEQITAISNTNKTPKLDERYQWETTVQAVTEKFTELASTSK